VHVTPEYWPTRELAQAVLDKFQPKPEHVWEHGDVFRGRDGEIEIYMERLRRKPRVFCLTKRNYCEGHDDEWALNMIGCEFLFNIKEKL
jgi:hypothetical protein